MSEHRKSIICKQRNSRFAEHYTLLYVRDFTAYAANRTGAFRIGTEHRTLLARCYLTVRELERLLTNKMYLLAIVALKILFNFFKISTSTGKTNKNLIKLK